MQDPGSSLYSCFQPAHHHFSLHFSILYRPFSVPSICSPCMSWTILLLKSPLPEPEQQHCRETHAPRALPLLPRDCYSTVMLCGVAQRSCKGQELLGSNSDGTCSLAILPWKNSALYPNACRESEQAVYPHLKPCNPPFSFPSLHRVATGHLA